MAVSVVMPALEMAQETGKLVSWLKKEGEQVRKGEMLLEIETDKAVVEVEAAVDGTLAGITAQPGDVIQVGKTIAWLLQPGESVPAAVIQETPTARRTDETRSTGDASHAAPVSGSRGPRMSPKARRLAQERGVDLAAIRGSGADGEILAADLPRQPAGNSVERLMAERTTASWTTAPHFFVTRHVDAGPLNAARERSVSGGTKATHTDLIVSAVARALKHHPRLNSTWQGDGVVLHSKINVALAMAVENAVVAAVIRDADTRDVAAISEQRAALTDRARAGRLQPADIADATFTISNLGMYGVDAFTAIIVPPQAAILAVGAITDRVVAAGGQPVVRPMMTLTLSCDHRVVDGARAAEFLRDLTSLLGD